MPNRIKVKGSQAKKSSLISKEVALRSPMSPLPALVSPAHEEEENNPRTRRQHLAEESDDDVIEVARVQAAPRGSVHPIVGPEKVVPVAPPDEPQAGPSPQGDVPKPDANHLGQGHESEEDDIIPGSTDDESEREGNEERVGDQPSPKSIESQYDPPFYRMTNRSILRNEEGDMGPMRTRACPVRYCVFQTRWACRLRQHCAKYHVFDIGLNLDTPADR